MQALALAAAILYCAPDVPYQVELGPDHMAVLTGSFFTDSVTRTECEADGLVAHCEDGAVISYSVSGIDLEIREAGWNTSVTLQVCEAENA